MFRTWSSWASAEHGLRHPVRIGAQPAAAFDINTACTSFSLRLSAATALIRTQVVRNALVIGAELISPFMDWSDRMSRCCSAMARLR